MPVPPHHFDDEPSDTEPGGLLDELERRQEDVLNQLDDLDAKLSEVLKGLEPAPADSSETSAAAMGEGAFDELAFSEPQVSEPEIASTLVEDLEEAHVGGEVGTGDEQVGCRLL